MEKDSTMKVLITAFVVLILAIAFLSSISDQTNNAITKTIVTDETTDLSTTGCLTGDGQVNESNSLCNITVVNYPTSWKIEDCPIASVVVSNDTTALTVDTDYVVFASSGVIQLLNTTETENATIGNSVLIDYTYCPDNYVNTSWGRSILGTNVGLYAIAILAVIIAAVYLLLGRKDND